MKKSTCVYILLSVSVILFASCSSGHGDNNTSSNPELKTCQICNGEGVVYVVCEECDGEGEIIVSCNRCYGSGQEKCSDCYGSGKKVCDDCNGNGGKPCS